MKKILSAFAAALMLAACGPNKQQCSCREGGECTCGDSCACELCTATGSELKMTVSDPLLDEKTKHYSFTATVTGDEIDAKNVSYQLSRRGFEGTDAENTDGKFSDVEGLKGVLYVVTAIVKGGAVDTTLYCEVDCPYIMPDLPQLSVEEMQQLFDKLRDDISSPLMGSSDLIVPNMELSFTNLQSGDKKPSCVGDIQEKLAWGDWSGVKVISLDYDEYNRVKKMTFEIKY